MKLREEHEDELRMMKEQNDLLREELIKQRERDEASVCVCVWMCMRVTEKCEVGCARRAGWRLLSLAPSLFLFV